MKTRNGAFVISLDFELHWGIFDVKSVEEYKENLDHTRNAIQQMMDLSAAYGIRLTFSTVGMLFAKGKKELNSFLPKQRPSYTHSVLSPYHLIDEIGENEEVDPYHYAQKIIKEISKVKQHEIGTHTFCHYYCCEEGQTIDEFDADLKAAIKIASHLGISIKSIVFPRNQVKDAYLAACHKNGITSYRGTEQASIYKPETENQTIKIPRMLKKGLRLADSYINIFGFCTYAFHKIKPISTVCINLPSSQFLRPYNTKLSFLEPLKIRRIKKAMSHAAKNDHLYHLWWHPHNFGANMQKNIHNLEIIFKHYQKLNSDHGFKSETMSSLTEKLV